MKERAENDRLLVTTSTFPRWEGDATPRFVRDLATMAADRYRVTVLAPHHPGASKHERGIVDVERFVYFRPERLERLCYDGGILPNARGSLLARIQIPGLVGASALALRRALRLRPALVHAHFLVPQGIVARAVVPPRIPLVVSAHGSDVFAMGGMVAHASTRAVLSRARLVTVNGEAMERELVRRFGDATAAKLRCLPMGVDVDAPPERTPDGSILFVGRLSRQKGAHVLFDAVRRLGSARPLVVVGDGPERASLERAARDLRVELRGGLSEHAVREAYRSASVVVVPSLGTEAQGLVALEAMAAGAPVVASDAGGLAEALGPRDAPRGWPAPPGDAAALASAIAEALANADEAARRAARARTWVVAERSLARTRERLHAIYAEAIDSRWR